MADNAWPEHSSSKCRYWCSHNSSAQPTYLFLKSLIASYFIILSVSIWLSWIIETYHDNNFVRASFHTFPLFSVAVELQSQNSAASPQRLLQCSRASQPGANAAKCFSQKLESDFGHVLSTCSIFPPLNCHLPRRQRWQVTQEAACNAVSGLASVFVQDAVIYRSTRQHSSTAELFN